MLSYSESAAAGLAPDRLDRVYAYLEEVAQSGQIPGAAVRLSNRARLARPRLREAAAAAV